MGVFLMDLPDPEIDLDAQAVTIQYARLIRAFVKEGIPYNAALYLTATVMSNNPGQPPDLLRDDSVPSED